MKNLLKLSNFENKNISDNIEVDWSLLNKSNLESLPILEVHLTEKKKSILKSNIFDEDRFYEMISLTDNYGTDLYYLIEIYINKSSKNKMPSLNRLNDFQGTLKVYSLSGDYIGDIAVLNGLAVTNEAKLTALKNVLDPIFPPNQTNNFPLCSSVVNVTTIMHIDRYEVWTTESGQHLVTNYVGTDLVTTHSSYMISWPCGMAPDPEMQETFHSQHSYNTIPDVVVEAPEKPIADMIQFFRCIDTKRSGTVTISAQQPRPGYNNPYWGSAGVGHSFITITQVSISLTFGFYPETGWGILSSTAGTMGDDGGHIRNVTVAQTVSGTKLQQIMSLGNQYNSQQYDIHDNNCTDFAIQVGNLMGWGLPDCTSPFLASHGSNPGAFGQYLRTMTLPPGTIRTTGNSYAPANVQCN